MIRQGVVAVAISCLLAMPVFADGPTLSELREQLSGLRNELQSLRSDLTSAGPEGYRQAGGDSTLDRMNAVEAKLSQLTNQTEQMQNRIHRIVEDGTRRIEDIEFRLCEMDEACNLGELTTPELGSQATGAATPTEVLPVTPPETNEDQGSAAGATAAEQADFNAALEVLDQGDYMQAAEMFAEVAENHAGGALTAEALYLRGSALENAGKLKEAAVAWLEGFTAEPDGPRAAKSLLGVASAVAAEGEPVASCLYLAEIPARFAETTEAKEAEKRMLVLNCGETELSGEEMEGEASPTPTGEATDPEAAGDQAAHELSVE